MKKIILIIFVFSTFIACKKDPKPGSVSLKMNHQVRSEAFVMNQKLYSSNSGHDYEITKLWYYLSEISLIDATGNKHTTAKGFLVKAEDEQSFTMQLDALPAGEYTQLKFQFGFEKEKNIESYLPSTADNQNMYWPVQMGPGDYHYMKYEGRFDSLNTGVMKNFIMHAGPTMGADNSFSLTYNLTSPLKIDDNAYTINIAVDLQEWIENPTDYDFNAYQNVMMNPAAQAVYKANGPSVFKLGTIDEILSE